MKRMLVSLSVFAYALALALSNAHAACSGCNLVDNGDFAYIYPGSTVYIDSTTAANEAVTVVAVDRGRYEVLVRHASGVTDWHLARALYTSTKVRERDNNTVAAGVGVVALLGLAVLAGSGSGNRGNSNSGSQTYGSSSNKSYDDDYYRRNQPAPAPQPTYKPDTSIGCAWGDRASGTCH